MSCRAAGSVAVLTLAVLAGCSEADPPASLPTPTVSSTPTTEPKTTTAAPPTSATPTGAPTVPAAAQEQTPDGAAAFVQHWFDSVNYAIRTTESTSVRILGECPSCLAIAESIDQVADKGNSLTGGIATVTSVQPTQIQSNGSTTVVALLSATPTDEVNPQGNIVATIDPGATNVQYLFTLAWGPSAWLVASIQVLE